MLKINKITIIYFTILKNLDTRCYKKFWKIYKICQKIDKNRKDFAFIYNSDPIKISNAVFNSSRKFTKY